MSASFVAAGSTCKSVCVVLSPIAVWDGDPHTSCHCPDVCGRRWGTCEMMDGRCCQLLLDQNSIDHSTIVVGVVGVGSTTYSYRYSGHGTESHDKIESTLLDTVSTVCERPGWPWESRQDVVVHRPAIRGSLSCVLHFQLTDAANNDEIISRSPSKIRER